MDIRFQALYVNAPITLLLTEHCSSLEPPPDWKTMPEVEFMEKYGKQVQAKYNLPTKEELNILNGDEDEESQEQSIPQMPEPFSPEPMIDD